jgi:hypothetical protein
MNVADSSRGQQDSFITSYWLVAADGSTADFADDAARAS